MLWFFNITYSYIVPLNGVTWFLLEPEAEADQPETPTEPAKSEPQLPPPFIGNPLGGPPLPPMLPPGMRGPFPPMPPPGMLRLDGLPPLPPLGGNLLPFPGPFGPPLPGLPIQNDPRLRPEMVRGIPPSNDQFRPPNNKITPPLQLERPSFQPRNGPNDSLETQQPPRPPFRHRFPPPNIRGPFFPPRNQDMHQNRFPPPMDPNRDRGNITGESQAEENRFVRRDSAEEHRKPGFPGGNNAPGNVPPTEMLPSDASASNLKRKKNKPKKPIFGGVFGGIFPFGNEDGREEENNSETPPWLKNSEKDKAPNHPVEGQPGNVRPMRPPRMDGQQRNPPPIPPMMPGQPRIPPPMQLRMLGQPRNPPPRAPLMEGQPRNGPAFSGLPPGIFVTEQPRFGMGERESLLPPGKPHISKDEEGVNFRRELDNMDKSKDIQKAKRNTIENEKVTRKVMIDQKDRVIENEEIIVIREIVMSGTLVGMIEGTSGVMRGVTEEIDVVTIVTDEIEIEIQEEVVMEEIGRMKWKKHMVETALAGMKEGTIGIKNQKTRISCLRKWKVNQKSKTKIKKSMRLRKILRQE